jgi:methionine synthase I (cobalamin-dependent)
LEHVSNEINYLRAGSVELVKAVHDEYFSFNSDDIDGKTFASFAEALADYHPQKA